MQELTPEDIEQIWNSVSHYVPDRQKADCAVDFIKTLVDVGISTKTIKAAGEYDEKLEQAIETVFEQDDNGEDYEEE
jgi:predicted ATP-grasp superfamily ATP-dependent carboligase